MLKIEQLMFQYENQPAASTQKMSFNLQVEAGEVLSLIGPSGSGKSTLLHLIAGFIQPSQGRIRVDGQAIQNLVPAQRPVTIVFQEHNLFPHLDVFTNIALGINPSLNLTEDQQDSIYQAVKNLDLQGLQNRKPGQLSGGQKQRVAIARALVRDSKILLLDEPFAALGPALREEMIGLVRELVQKQGIAALLVSHQPKDAELASKRTAFIDRGQVVVVDDTQKLLSDSTNHEVNEYLGTV